MATRARQDFRRSSSARPIRGRIGLVRLSPTHDPEGSRRGLLNAISGGNHGGTQSQLERHLLETLGETLRVLVVDEAQRLNYECVEMLRHLHDQLQTTFALLLVGGDGCHDLILRYPMLSSRIARWTKFAPLSPSDVPALLPQFHPLYTRTDPDLLETVDLRYAGGNLRHWATFTQAVAGLAQQEKLDYLVPDIIDAALALVGIDQG